MELLKGDVEQSIYLIKNRNEEKVLKIIKDPKKRDRKKRELEICVYMEKYKIDCVVPQKISGNSYRDIYLEEFVKGVTLNSFIKKQILFEEISYNIISKLYEISKVPIEKDLYNILNIEEDYDWYFYLNNNFNIFIEKIEKNGYLKFDIISKIKKYWEKNSIIFKTLEKKCLIHNDLNGENIIVYVDEIRGEIECKIIDFEWCIIGDPLKELSKLLWVLNKNLILKDIFYRSYKKIFKHNFNFELKLELYWLYDMLNHIQQQDYLLKFRGWDKYLEEEKWIIENIILAGDKNNV